MRLLLWTFDLQLFRSTEPKVIMFYNSDIAVAEQTFLPAIRQYVSQEQQSRQQFVAYTAGTSVGPFLYLGLPLS